MKHRAAGAGADRLLDRVMPTRTGREAGYPPRTLDFRDRWPVSSTNSVTPNRTNSRSSHPERTISTGQDRLGRGGGQRAEAVPRPPTRTAHWVTWCHGLASGSAAAGSRPASTFSTRGRPFPALRSASAKTMRSRRAARAAAAQQQAGERVVAAAAGSRQVQPGFQLVHGSQAIQGHGRLALRSRTRPDGQGRCVATIASSTSPASPRLRSCRIRPSPAPGPTCRISAAPAHPAR